MCFGSDVLAAFAFHIYWPMRENVMTKVTILVDNFA